MLNLNKVNKTYSDGTQALKDISISFPKGMIGLLGPNGAGKSTLMRTLAGLQQADSGQINFDGIDTIVQPETLRKNLGYLPQEFGVYPNMPCGAMLDHMAILKGLSKSERQVQIPNLLQMTNLTAMVNKNVADFSGGMKQRFGIAQALLGNPKLIIMDEPTAGLDPVERERLNNVLVEISKDRLVLLSTHIVEDVENLCHFVALQFNGEILVHGDIPTLLKPLENRVWQSSDSVISKIPDATQQLGLNEDIIQPLVLSKSFMYGEPSFRIFSAMPPNESASRVMPTLQDKYFLEQLKKAHDDVY